MSALVSVTIVTADRKVFRFTDLAEAETFNWERRKAEAPKVRAPRQVQSRDRGENRRLMLAHLCTVESSSCAEIATAIGSAAHTIKKVLAHLLDEQKVVITHRGQRGARYYAITDTGREEARHAQAS